MTEERHNEWRSLQCRKKKENKTSKSVDRKNGEKLQISAEHDIINIINLQQ